jgi:putative flippase GtrA
MDIKKIFTKLFNKETILYVIFGVLTTLVDFGVFSFLYYITGINEVVANTIAWFFAVIVAYITNKTIVFEKYNFEIITVIKELIAFFLARVFSLVITNVFLVFAAHIGMNMLLAKAIISVVVVILNYFFSKLFIFKEK